MGRLKNGPNFDSQMITKKSNPSQPAHKFRVGVTEQYPLVNVYIAMENHHFSWKKTLFLWLFSIAFCIVHQRVHPVGPVPSAEKASCLTGALGALPATDAQEDF